MGIIIGIFFVLFLIVYSIPTRKLDRQGKEAMDRANENHHKAQKEMAERYDFYYRRNECPSLDVNNRFYSDGSLLQDSRTGRYFKKGEYFCDGYGCDADGNQVADSVPRPPQTRF